MKSPLSFALLLIGLACIFAAVAHWSPFTALLLGGILLVGVACVEDIKSKKP